MQTVAPALLSLLLAVFATAQDAPQQPAPAAELKKFEPLIGTWTGKGTAVMAPGAKPIEWTSRASYQWALDKHFVVGDTIVDFGNGLPPIGVREILGWDGENKRFVAITADNGCNSSFAELEFPKPDTMVNAFTRKAQGQVMTERRTTTFGKDGFGYVIAMYGSTGPAVDCVIGAFTRASDNAPVVAGSVGAMEAVGEMSKKMNRAVGTYDVTGEMTMMPGMPVTKITGRDVCTTIFGGAVFQVATTGAAAGQPGGYEALNLTVWNGDKHCFDSYVADNMGYVGAMEQRFVGEQLVATSASNFMGQPMAQRTVMDLDGAGRLTKVRSWSIVGTSEPFRSFEASYKPAK